MSGPYEDRSQENVFLLVFSCLLNMPSSAPSLCPKKSNVFCFCLWRNIAVASVQNYPALVEFTVNNHTYGDSSNLQGKKTVGNSINNSKILKSLNYSKLTFRFVSNVDGHYILNHENISKEFGSSHTHTNYFSSMKTIDSDYYF